MQVQGVLVEQLVSHHDSQAIREVVCRSVMNNDRRTIQKASDDPLLVSALIMYDDCQCINVALWAQP